MPSFDVVSEVDMQEVDNALNQARKEIETRYDFKGSKSEIKHEKDKGIVLVADDTMKLKSLNDIINQKFAKRGISPKSLDAKEAENASGNMLRQIISLKQGIKTEDAKRIVKSLKDSGIKKVQAQIQGEQVRVTGPKKDDLQAAMKIIKENISDLDLQFTNFRD